MDEEHKKHKILICIVQRSVLFNPLHDQTQHADHQTQQNTSNFKNQLTMMYENSKQHTIIQKQTKPVSKKNAQTTKKVFEKSHENRA